MTTYVIRIPAPTKRARSGRISVAWLSANARRNYLAVSDDVRRWRALGKEAALEAGLPTLRAARIVAVVHKTRGGRWDPSNLAPTAKAVLDGIVDAGVLPDDSTEYVEGPDMRAGVKAAEACLVLYVTELEKVTTWLEP